MARKGKLMPPVPHTLETQIQQGFESLQGQLDRRFAEVTKHIDAVDTRQETTRKEVLDHTGSLVRVETNQKLVLDWLKKLNGGVVDAHLEAVKIKDEFTATANGILAKLNDHVQACPLHDRMDKTEKALADMIVEKRTTWRDFNFVWAAVFAVFIVLLTVWVEHSGLVATVHHGG